MRAEGTEPPPPKGPSDQIINPDKPFDKKGREPNYDFGDKTKPKAYQQPKADPKPKAYQ